MKTIFSSIAFLFSTAIFSQITTEARPVGDFTGVRTSAGYTIELTQADANSVLIEGEAADIKDVKAEVNDGILSITDGKSNGDIKIKISVKNLRVLDLSGSSSTTSTNQLTIDTLNIVGSSASSIKLDVNANTIKSTLSGASTLKLSGTSSKLIAVLSGASDLKAYQLTSDKVIVTTSGAASAHVSPTSSLNATSSGASEIHYQGSPAEKNVNASGASSIVMKEGKENVSDTTNIHIGKYDVHVSECDDEDKESKDEKKSDNSDFEFWKGIDFGVNGLLTANNQVELPTGFDFLQLNYSKSYVFSWNMFQKNIHIYKNYVNLGTGIGMTWNHYDFRKSYSLTPNVNYATATFDSLKYSKNRLNMAYLNVPLFLEFNTNNSDAKNSFHFGAGMEFGYNVFNNKLKQKYELDGRNYKRKLNNDFNVNPFRYDVIARVGYGDFTIFGAYSLSTLFEKGKGPVVYPFSAGINFSF
ncbi:MAG: DUF2807 domain-containing protein [Bacteroidetes bacterium]|nr:DUF2807 domain-containing protein [Bacteroidota bacterium]